MPEAYCVKCKTKREISHPVPGQDSRGRSRVSGKCPTCGTNLYRYTKQNGAAVVARRGIKAAPASSSRVTRSALAKVAKKGGFLQYLPLLMSLLN
jgi:hypothetical protein